ncbi:hypothetical protein HDV00_011395 [Rhizophlyctis rosea]|nr:hypothetical protein HDV00_011395 [Rhizophlyctis rosea]
MAEKIIDKTLKFNSKAPAITTRYEHAHVSRLVQLQKCANLDSTVHEQIKSYLRLRHQDTNTFRIEYLFSKTSPECRLYARKLVGSQGFQREVRCYVMENLYKDYDLRNCFPELTLQLGKTKNIPQCNALQKYVKDTEQVLKSLKMTKKDFLAALNKSYHKPQNKLLRSIHDFIYDEFVPAFQKDPQFEELWTITKKLKSHNAAGSFYSKICQYYENQILTEIDNYLGSKGYDTKASVLIFDGIQTLQREGDDPIDLRNLEKHIQMATSFDMTVVEKTMAVDTNWLASLGLQYLTIQGDDEGVVHDEIKIFRPDLYDDGELDQLAKEAILYRTHDAIARFLFVLWMKEFYYKDGTWWFFANHHWQMDTGHHFSRRQLMELRKMLDERTEWKSRSQDPELCGMLQKLNSLIGNRTFYKNVTNTAAVYFSMKDFSLFEKKLDCNLHLLCFKNGVYDLDKREFRDGTPSDYCLKQINYKYIEFDPTCEITRGLMEMLAKVLVNKDKRDYLMKELAAALGCHTTDKFNILHGGGAKAKSWLMGLVGAAFDVYGLSWNTSVLVHDISGDSANPELADGEVKRFIDIQESKKNKALNMENVNRLTGYDRIRARKLYQDGKTFVIIAILFLCVNDLPTISEVDNGTWRRMNVITFPSRFVSEPDEVDEKNNVFLADPRLKKRHETNAPYFMSILIHYYKRYIDEGNRTPESVRKDTLKFKEHNDVYNKFFNDRCIKDPEGKLLVEELWREVQKWAKIENNKALQIDRMDMVRWFKSLGEQDSTVAYEDKLRVTKTVEGRRMSKVSTGFRGVRLNKYQEEKVQSTADKEVHEDDDDFDDATAYAEAIEAADREFKRRRLG